MILLTGHEGFIGKSLRHYYNTVDWTCVPPTIDVGSDLFQSYVRGMSNISAVVHCAGNSIVSQCEENPLDAYRSNTLATASVLEAVRKNVPGVPVVILESDKVYGTQSDEAIGEFAPLNGFSPYEKSKVLAAELCDFYRDYYSMDVISLRLTNTYGPLDTNLSRLIPGTVARLRRGEAPVVWAGSEDARRDYLWIEDLCKVIMAFTRGKNLAGAYNVTSEENYSTREVIDIIQGVMGTELPILIKDKDKDFSEIPFQRMCGDKVRYELGWGPSTKLRDGIRKMLDTAT